MSFFYCIFAAESICDALLQTKYNTYTHINDNC